MEQKKKGKGRLVSETWETAVCGVCRSERNWVWMKANMI